MKLNKYIDHTLLKATATPNDIKMICDQAREHNFYAVCINGSNTLLASNELKNSNVKVVSVIGFPLGANSFQSKVYEAAQCVNDGADEIDMVLNLGLLKGQLHDDVREEIAAVKAKIGDRTLKVILETCYLTDSEIIMACQLSKQAKADFVKTSTGFGPEGATEHVVKLMIDEVGNFLKIKASGGIKDAETAKKYIEMGASRIGTSSGIKIVSSKKNK